MTYRKQTGKREFLFGDGYEDEDGYYHIPSIVRGEETLKCDDCGKMVNEVFVINPCELLLKLELCHSCYVKDPQSLTDILEGI